MVKGVSRQVIVVHSPDPKMFDQAIFILKDEVVNNNGITDEALMKEAKRLISAGSAGKRSSQRLFGPLWACVGALIMGFVWLLSVLI
jgi:hypothetical protein